MERNITWYQIRPNINKINKTSPKLMVEWLAKVGFGDLGDLKHALAIIDIISQTSALPLLLIIISIFNWIEEVDRGVLIE